MGVQIPLALGMLLLMQRDAKDSPGQVKVTDAFLSRRYGPVGTIYHRAS
jgi:hypothetical protein